MLILVSQLSETPRQPETCVIHAAQEAANHVEAKILMVRYNEIEMGHAYCVYREEGIVYASDWRGRYRLSGTFPPAELAARLLPLPVAGLTIKSAAYEWESK